MPVMTCQKGEKPGHKFGPRGVCFTGSNSRAKAESVGRAISAQGTEKRMDRLQVLKDIAHGEPVQESANFAEILKVCIAIEMAAHPTRGARPRCPPGQVMRDGRCVKKTTKSLLGQLKALINKSKETTCIDCGGESFGTQTMISTAPPVGELIAKSIDEDKGLVTAVILRPNVPDLHGDIYDALEVEKACFNFNTRCGQINIQHEEMVNFQMVESFIVKADARLGEGEVLTGDWIGTMHIDPSDPVWTQIRSGEFTGFSVGCKATVETI